VAADGNDAPKRAARVDGIQRGGGQPSRNAARMAGALLVGLLGGCQVPPLPMPPRPPAASVTGLATLPSCPSGVTATLNTGMAVSFVGAAPHHPQVCLRRMNGHTYRYFLGFWGDGWFHDGNPEERAAIRQVLRGPVGTRVSFPLARPTPLAIWRSASVTHVANPLLMLDGTTQRRTLLLRVERHGPPDRPDVATETLWWLDRRTLIPLKREEVVHLAHGTERQTAWEVRRLLPGAG
jgi:hypothetical protein